MDLIKRIALKELKEHLSQREISLVVGPRQAGKTTLLRILHDSLKNGGKNVLFLDLDNESDRMFFATQSNLIKKIELEIGKAGGFVFIDEIQRREDAGLFLKGIYDMNLPYKFIVSGSGSLELKEKVHESLVGRKRVFELSTVSFDEFVNFRTGYKYEDRLNDFFEVEKEKTGGLFDEYLNFGGYPRVVLEEKLDEKRKIIDEIFGSYLEKDISYLLKVEKSEKFGNLIRILAGGIGQIINYSELSSTIGIAAQTLKNYIWYAEKTFIVEKLAPYFTNVRKEISKSPKIYFYDLGLRNYCLGSFGAVNPVDAGHLFENFIFDVLKYGLRFTGAHLAFWRTKDKAEVDFVISMKDELIPIEVKYSKLKTPQIGRSTRSFIEKYNPKSACVINLGLRETTKVGDTKVMFLPFWKLIGVPLESIL